MSIKTSNKVVSDLSKLELFDGTNYHRWSQKLLIFFEKLEVNYVLTIDPSSDPSTTIPTPYNLESMGFSAVAVDQVNKVSIVDLEKYVKDNKTVCGHLLNHMLDPMFNLFMAQKSANDIWSILESR